MHIKKFLLITGLAKRTINQSLKAYFFSSLIFNNPSSNQKLAKHAITHNPCKSFYIKLQANSQIEASRQVRGDVTAINNELSG